MNTLREKYSSRGSRVILLALLLLAACKQVDLQPLEFFEVEMLGKPERLNLDSLRLNGRLSGLMTSSVEQCGFLYATDAEAIFDVLPSVGRLNAAILPTTNGDFEATLAARPDQTFYFRAFAQMGARTVYSDEILSSDAQELTIVLDSTTATISNDSATVYGLLTGLEAEGLRVKAHGHVYSATDPAPTIQDSDTTNLGPSNDDGLFRSLLAGLNFNTTYHLRTYLVTENNQVVYSKIAEVFRVRDGWRRVADFPIEYQDATAAASESVGKSFVGFGCNAVEGCLLNGLTVDYWSFSAPDNWATAPGFPGERCTNASSFAIDDDIYTLFGENQSPQINFVSNFQKYAINSSQWATLPALPSGFVKRSGAVSFVLDSKAYVGTGLNNTGELRDFWQYNPANGQWRTVASLKLRVSTTDPTEYVAGRREAAAFAIGGYGYVGGGESGVLGLTDFWRFTPPTDDLGLGEWTFVGFFPGLARVEAVSFDLNGKGYYGTGYHSQQGSLTDWWEFDPARPEPWRRKTALPGGRRQRAVGFPLAGKGYLGTGYTKIITNNGNSTDNRLYRDFWQYTPEN
jgi:N-acetylneuraminic acid mutarotase